MAVVVVIFVCCFFQMLIIYVKTRSRMTWRDFFSSGAYSYDYTAAVSTAVRFLVYITRYTWCKYQVLLLHRHGRIYIFLLPSTMYRTKYMIWSDTNRISSSINSTPPCILVSLRRHIFFPFLKSPLYNFLTWHTLEIPSKWQNVLKFLVLWDFG